MSQAQKRPPAKSVKSDIDDIAKAEKSNTKANDPRQPGKKQSGPVPIPKK